MYKNLVPTSQETYWVFILKTKQLIVLGKVIDIFCEHHTKHINALCRQNVQFQNVQLVLRIAVVLQRGNVFQEKLTAWYSNFFSYWWSLI
jgi:hypothetical protein